MAISNSTVQKVDRQIPTGTKEKFALAVQTAENAIATNTASIATLTTASNQATSDIANLKLQVYGVATHDYGATATAWALTAAEALARVLIVTNASGAADITGTAASGISYVVRNTSGQAITIKKSGQSGVTIANTKTAVVVGIGTDYVRVTADA